MGLGSNTYGNTACHVCVRSCLKFESERHHHRTERDHTPRRNCEHIPLVQLGGLRGTIVYCLVGQVILSRPVFDAVVD